MIYDPYFKEHFLCVGDTGTGKGTLVSAMAMAYQRQGIPVYLLTRKEDEYYTFPADFKTMDQVRFLEACMEFKGSVVRNGERKAVGLMAVIDEAWRWRWATTKAGEGLEAIPCSGRSRGIEMWVQGQRMKQVPPNARGNCHNVIAFRQTNPEDVDEVRKYYGPDFASVDELKKGQFIARIEGNVNYGTSFEADENGKFKRGIKF